MDCGEALSQDPVNGPPDPGFALDDHEPALAVTGVIERPAQGLELCVTIEGRLRGLAGHALGPILFESGRGIRALRASSARRMQDASAVPPRVLSSRPPVSGGDLGVGTRAGGSRVGRSCLQADAVVCAHARETPAADEGQASPGAQSAPTTLCIRGKQPSRSCYRVLFDRAGFVKCLPAGR